MTIRIWIGLGKNENSSSENFPPSPPKTSDGKEKFMKMWKQILSKKSYKFKLILKMVARYPWDLCPNCSVIAVIRAIPCIDVPRFSDAAIQPIYRPFPNHVPQLGCQRSPHIYISSSRAKGRIIIIRRKNGNNKTIESSPTPFLRVKMKESREMDRFNSPI